jgi:hypothetical protein
MRQNYDNISIEVLKEIVLQSDSLVEVTKKLGYDLNLNSSKKHIERLIKRNCLSIEHFSTVKRVREYNLRYDKNKLTELVKNSTTLKEILLELDILPIVSNYRTLKKYLKKYDIDFSHILLERITQKPKLEYTEENIKESIKNSKTFRDVFEKLGLTTHGNNYKTLRKYIKLYNIDISHFNSKEVIAGKLLKINKIPIENILVENSTYEWTSNLKKRLYDENFKERKCEKCGQNEMWYGEHISLILDHINGVYNDNRLENLRILCPNCNATLSTHCGKNVKKYVK